MKKSAKLLHKLCVLLFGLSFFSSVQAINLPSGFTSELVVGNLGFPVVMDWAPDGRLFLGTKDGRVQVLENGAVLAENFIDISGQVNDFHDRGMLGLAVHPNFPTTPYVYLYFTYDPPGLPGGEFGSPDGGGPRVSRLIRVTADPANTNKALAGSEVVLLGSNSTLANIGHPELDGWFREIGGSCENPDGSPIVDCIASDSPTHTVGTLMFGNDGALYAGHGDGATFAPDTRLLKVQDLNSPAGKILRIDPVTGDGLSDNPFYDGDPTSWKSKVYQLGLKNQFRFTIDDAGDIWNGDVGTNRWEEINVGGAGVNFGYPCYEGASGVNEVLDTGLHTSSVCQALYAAEAATPGTVVPPVYAYDHSLGGASVQASSKYSGNTYPSEFDGAVFYVDYNRDWIKYLTFDEFGAATPNDFADDVGGTDGGPVWSRQGPDGNIYYIVFRRYQNTFTAELRRFIFGSVANNPPIAVASASPLTGDAPLPVSFSSAGSSDPDSDPLTFLWSFGDGNTSTEASPQHTYTVEGSYTVTLTVTDTNNASADDVLTVDVTGGNLPDPGEAIGPYLNGTFPTTDSGSLPATLSATGAFNNLTTLEPAPGLILYAVNSQLWSDRAEKSRWLILPNDGYHTDASEKIVFSPDSPWSFPVGTVVIKQFSLGSTKVETRFLVNGTSGWYALTYRWRPDGTEADLLTTGITETINYSGGSQEWTFPSRDECMQCHTESSGRVLAVNTWQLNRDLDGINQLENLSAKGIFNTTLDSASISGLLKAAPIDDPNASLEQRVRSYLDSNCAHCHNPSNNVRALFDARFSTPLAQQDIINGQLEDTLGVPGAQVVVPGDPGASMLYLRAHSLADGVAMPPLAKNQLDLYAMTPMRDWIHGLAAPSYPGTLEADYRNDFTTGQAAGDWRYLWNEFDSIGVMSGYRSLIWDGEYRYDSDGSNIPPDSSEFAYGNLTEVGGHPGSGLSSGASAARFGITEYTVPAAGTWYIADSYIQQSSCEWSDGIDLSIYVNDDLKSLTSLNPDQYHDFDQSLGQLVVGDKVYVAVGPGESDGCDGFVWDFSFTREATTPNVIAGYQSDFNAGSVAPGWSYSWNATGPIGIAANYESLIWDGGFAFDSDGSPGQDATPLSYGQLHGIGGHPGQGPDNGEATPRYVIAGYTAPGYGNYGLVNSSIQPGSCQWTDGLALEVYVNDAQRFSDNVAYGSLVSFDQALGTLSAGDQIFVAVGPGASDGCDGFDWDFSITYDQLPDPGDQSEIVAGYQRDYSPAQPSSQWQYQWNGGGAIDQGGFLDYLWDGDYRYDSDGAAGLPDNSGAGWGHLNDQGGHPGKGVNDGETLPRYSIASYTTAEAGDYALVNAVIQNSSCSFSDGAELTVLVNGVSVYTQSYPADGSLDFSQSLGALMVGDTISVAAGPGLDYGCDGFTWDFDIELTP